MNVGHIVNFKPGFGGRIVDVKLGSLFFSQNSYVKDIDDPELLSDLYQRGAQGQAVKYFVGQRRSELEVCGVMRDRTLEDVVVHPHSGDLITV